MSRSYPGVGCSTVRSGLFFPAVFSHSYSLPAPCLALQHHPVCACTYCRVPHALQGRLQAFGIQKEYFPFVSKPQLFTVPNKHMVLEGISVRLRKCEAFPRNTLAFQYTSGKTARAPQHLGSQFTEENKHSSLAKKNAKPLPKETAPSPLFRLEV